LAQFSADLLFFFFFFLYASFHFSQKFVVKFLPAKVVFQESLRGYSALLLLLVAADDLVQGELV